jgi:hypothetical protein
MDELPVELRADVGTTARRWWNGPTGAEDRLVWRRNWFAFWRAVQTARAILEPEVNAA